MACLISWASQMSHHIHVRRLWQQPEQHVKRSKHFDIVFHFSRECIERGEITVKHVRIDLGEQRADILTKALPE